jgi:hypothetical protein
MNTTNPLDSDDQIERGDLKVSAEELAATLRWLSDGSIREIDQLINQLQRLRSRLKSAGDRIQGEIAGYAELSQQTMQLTSIIVDTVRKLPPGTSRYRGRFSLFATAPATLRYSPQSARPGPDVRRARLQLNLLNGLERNHG